MLSFRPVTPDDRALLQSWLNEPHVNRWYDEPGPDHILSHIEDDRVTPLIVCEDDTPVGYLQHYRIHGWDDHPLGFLPQGSRGIDMFIGASDRIGRGLGPRILQAMCQQLIGDGAPALGIDPEPANTAAIRAYSKVGFVPVREADTEWGRVLLMQLIPPIQDL